MYDVSRTIETATLTGFIETNGDTETLAIGDIVDWNLVLTNQAVTLDLTGPLSGNNSVDSDSILDGNLTASAADLFFDFGAETRVTYCSSPQAFLVPANNTIAMRPPQNRVCAGGEEIVPVSIFDPRRTPPAARLRGT